MNKALLILIFSLVASLFSISAFADGLVNFPTGNAAWTIDITYHETPTNSATPAPPVTRKPVKIEVTQVDSYKRVVITYADGKTSENWSISNVPVLFETLARDQNTVIPVEPSVIKDVTEYNLPYDSFGFAWIEPNYLQEKDPIDYQDTKCLHYKGAIALPVASPGSSNASSGSATRETWINAANRLPVALDTGTSLYTFTFAQKPPTQPLTPPANFEKEISYYKMVMGYH